MGCDGMRCAVLLRCRAAVHRCVSVSPPSPVSLVSCSLSHTTHAVSRDRWRIGRTQVRDTHHGSCHVMSSCAVLCCAVMCYAGMLLHAPCRCPARRLFASLREQWTSCSDKPQKSALKRHMAALYQQRQAVHVQHGMSGCLDAMQLRRAAPCCAVLMCMCMYVQRLAELVRKYKVLHLELRQIREQV